MEIQTQTATDELTRWEDRQLVAACLDGDSAAWEAIITRYQRLVYSIPVRGGLSQDDAADIFQAVCLKLFEKLSTLRDHDKICAWLITTTTRECWRLSARNRRQGLVTGFDEEGVSDGLETTSVASLLPDEEREIIERQQIVRTAVDALSDRCRQLVTMLFYLKDELSYTDIARRMNMPVASVGPTRARCLEKLKKILQAKL